MQRIALIWHHLATAFAIGLCGWVLCGCDAWHGAAGSTNTVVTYTVPLPRITFVEIDSKGLPYSAYIATDSTTSNQYLILSGGAITKLENPQ